MINFKKSILAVCITSLVLAGCAAPGGQGGQSGSVNSDTALRCAAFGVGGALLGVMVGGKGAAVKGAAVGLAACAVVEIASRQTKSSATVDEQYRSSNRNQLPQTAKIDAYTMSVTPNGVAKAGDAIRVQSSIRAISGVRDPVTEVKEQLVVYAPSGEEFKRGEKKVNDSTGSGEYENTFTLRLPDGAPQGMYKFKTQIFLNGKPASVHESSVQVAALDLPSPHMAVAAR
ncbi:hypothetical protein HH213_28010 [Duganella dendranthematis]|uniref:Glycine zipper domain-containing protein n=1 Tax=Duganella dendranthematis TaxID=2728021 RepID=A0ABX6MH03_9BURK|nr:hypothetical protein [Duganella dendranthematis]QJD93590.1 hypothetical protein HH213_28010 [Duganella dendranthematis]